MERKVTSYGTVFLNHQEHFLDYSLAGETVFISKDELPAKTSKGKMKLLPLPYRCFYNNPNRKKAFESLGVKSPAQAVNG
jgi:hypothetical protein